MFSKKLEQFNNQYGDKTIFDGFFFKTVVNTELRKYTDLKRNLFRLKEYHF